MATSDMSSQTMSSMGGHPDIVAMSARYERAAETPTAQAADGLTVLAGLFVALSPWIVGFSQVGSTLAITNLVVGLAIAGLGVGFAYAAERMHRLSWVCPLLGVWTIVAVWAVAGTTATLGVVLSNVIGGGLVVLFGLAAAVPMWQARRAARD